MTITKTRFKGLLIIEVEVFYDKRGWFSETYSMKKLFEKGIEYNFVQDNQSFSTQKGTLRGIHFQINPRAQTKLIRCIKGAIIDTVVDLRKGSNTYKQWFSIVLSAENKKQLLIPKGFGHAFLSTTDDVEVQYKTDEYYSKEDDRSVNFKDPEIGVDWGTQNPVLSQKDSNAPFLNESDVNFSIKVLVTGAKGQLGSDIVNYLNILGIENDNVDIDNFDITNKESTLTYILKTRPDIVIHCAAYTAVDKAEIDMDACYKVNVDGTRNIAEACHMIDARMVYISTDYVFEGDGLDPQHEDKKTNPINYYGFCKEKGETIVREVIENHFIVRTSWIYGKNGNNFVKTMIKLAESTKEINVVNDQIGSPTCTMDLARLICDIIQTDKYGTFHCVNEGYCSWYDFALKIFEIMGSNIQVNSISSTEYPSLAKRPLNSRLSTKSIIDNGFMLLPSWEVSLERFLKDFIEESNLFDKEPVG